MYDEERFWKHSGAWCHGREKSLANLIMTYHVVEKGLTMPMRRMGFGTQVVAELIEQIRSFEERFGRDDVSLKHAIGVVKRYWQMHSDAGYDFREKTGFTALLQRFCEQYDAIPAACEPQFSRAEFYAAKNAPFPEFTAARHTVRHFLPDKEVPMDKIWRAVSMATSAPSACNRQHGRIYCVSDKAKCKEILSLQGGNRGFGHLADKVLVVASDLQDVLLPRERNDAFVNGGLFLMALCYGLYYEEVAHCILTWAQSPETDLALRRIVPLKESEVVIAVVACGEAPDEFDVAASPRRSIESVITVVQ